MRSAAPPNGSLLERTLAGITREALTEAAVDVVSIPSPTGHEERLAAWLVDRMSAAGMCAEFQPISGAQANAAGRVRGLGSGPDLMLYAPIDTLTTGMPEHDLPWAGKVLRDDMRPVGRVEGDFVTGLGAGNPKGHAACVLVTGLALHRAVEELGTPPCGDLLLGFGAGGMPTNAIDDDGPAHTGHGVGVSFMLERGWYADAAVIAKPGNFVAHDEVGLCWFEVRVEGTHVYVGSRHRLPYRNPIVAAAELIVGLESWLEAYSARHRTSSALPQGVIGSVMGGWERTASVTPATCRFRVDVRISPGAEVMDINREFSKAVRDLADVLDVTAETRLILAVPGSSTAPDAAVVRTTVEAWEWANEQPHVAAIDNSGATDANILRNRGVPTARVGMPKVASAADDFALGINSVDVNEMVRLSRLLAYTAVKSIA